MSISRVINIDPDNLDLHLLEQPELVNEYGNKLAKAKHELAEAKRILEMTRAQLSSKIRNNPSDYDIDKVTESTIANAVIAHKGYQRQLRIYNSASNAVDVLQVAVYAVNDRKAAIEGLIKLHGQKWFSTPNFERDINVAWKNRKKDIDSEIADGLNNTKKMRRTK